MSGGFQDHPLRRHRRFDCSISVGEEEMGGRLLLWGPLWIRSALFFLCFFFLFFFFFVFLSVIARSLLSFVGTPVPLSPTFSFCCGCLPRFREAQKLLGGEPSVSLIQSNMVHGHMYQ